MRCCIYQPRTYRGLCRAHGLSTYQIRDGESDLFIQADHDIRQAASDKLSRVRADLTGYIARHPAFVDTLEPVQVDEHAPDIVRRMADAAARVRVGPMAAVAGAISEEIARDLSVPGYRVIVENGGDIFAFSRQPLTIALYAGPSVLSMKLGLVVKECIDGVGVCTSSGSVGHSLSFGNADAVTVVARNGALADATATALGNIVQEASDIGVALEHGATIAGIVGIVIILGQHIGIHGEKIELSFL